MEAPDAGGLPPCAESSQHLLVPDQSLSDPDIPGQCCLLRRSGTMQEPEGPCGGQKDNGTADCKSLQRLPFPEEPEKKTDVRWRETGPWPDCPADPEPPQGFSVGRN